MELIQAGWCLEEDNLDFSALSEWEQYVGCSDKNEQDIYEGDILKWAYDSQDGDGVKQGINPVRYTPYSLCFELDDKEGTVTEFWDDPTFWTLKVVGNIHENPNLID